MRFPKQVIQEKLFNRAKDLLFALQVEKTFPDSPLKNLESLVKAVGEINADFSEIELHSSALLYWYQDQGAREIPLHALVGDFALDLVKMCRIMKVIDDLENQCNTTLEGRKEQALLSLRRLENSFASDGKLDYSIYETEAPLLRSLDFLI